MEGERVVMFMLGWVAGIATLSGVQLVAAVIVARSIDRGRA